jgi:sugar phosphate isomerase/epimerase
MKTNNTYFQKSSMVFLLAVALVMVACNTRPEKKSLVFKDYPNLKIGISTQNFLKALPLNVAGLTEVIDYASNEGYQFVEIRDQFVDLTNDDCKALAAVALEKKVDVIYVFNKNPLDTGYYRSFNKALANVMVFKGPGILRTLSSKSEFDTDPLKKGWTKEEFARLCRVSDSCALICKSKNIRFVFENSNEAFFGDSLTYFGLTDVLSGTTNVGLQLDIGNLFRTTARVQNNPENVIRYLTVIGDRWVETHLKTVIGGEVQPVLTDNPLPVEKVIELMGKTNVQFVTIELPALENKQQCIDNHSISIKFLRDKGILKE